MSEYEQLSIESYAPKARATDPPTSQHAGEVGRMRGDSIRAKLLIAFYDVRYEDGHTDEQAAIASATYRRLDGNLSEFATRCSELRRMGLIRFTSAERLGSSGLPREVSEITGAGILLVQENGWHKSEEPPK